MPHILLASIAAKRSAPDAPGRQMLALYLERAARLTPTAYRDFPEEARLLATLDASAQRTRPRLILADSLGKPLISEEFAASLGQMLDAGAQQIVLAIGPADGWSAAARARADLVLAFGRITLPHELAMLVAAEQVYRALTIRAGHPYHLGHKE